MTRHVTIIITAFCLLITTPVFAMTNSELNSVDLFEVAQNYVSDNTDKIVFNGEELSMDVFDHNSHGDGFQLYLTPTTGTGNDYGFSPEQLNNIEPAAGIKFTISLD